MKVAISTSGNTIDSTVDPRFGRCQNFLIVNIDTLEYQAIENIAQYEGHGAGISAAQFIVEKGVKAIISGNIGPNAFRVLASANIQLFTYNGIIKDAIIKLKNNELIAVTGPTNPGHSGIGRGSRGMGQGRNRR